MTKKQFNITLQDVYDMYKANPEYMGKINVLTRFGFYPIVDC